MFWGSEGPRPADVMDSCRTLDQHQFGSERCLVCENTPEKHRHSSDISVCTHSSVYIIYICACFTCIWINARYACTFIYEYISITDHERIITVIMHTDLKLAFWLACNNPQALDWCLWSGLADLSGLNAILSGSFTRSLCSDALR